MNRFFIYVLVLSMAFIDTANSAQLDLPLDANGWTVFTPSSDSRIMYVSATGDDTAAAISGIYTQATHPSWSNPFDPGTIQPFATLSAAMANARSGYPDWILLKRGDTFTISSMVAVAPKIGRSLTEPSLIGAYGSTDRSPIIQTNETVENALYIQSYMAYQYIAVSGIDFYSYTRDPNNEGYLGATGTSQRGLWIYKGEVFGVDEGILIEGCKFRFFNNSAINTYQIIDGLEIRRNLFLDNWEGPGQGHSQGLFINNQSPVMEENIFIHNGWQTPYGSGEDGPATIFNHNTYMLVGANGILFKNNILAQSSNSNVKIMAKTTSNQMPMVYDNNLIIDGQFGLGFGNNNIGNTSPFKFLNVSNNVISDMGMSKNLQGLARGISITYDTDEASVSKNIILNQKDNSITDSIALRIGGILRNVNFDNNITFNVKNTVNMQVDDVGDANSTGSAKTGIVFSNNKMQTDENAGYIASVQSNTNGVTFTNNKYYSNRADGARYRIAGVNETDAQWATLTGDSSTFEQHPFPDPTRSIETYMASLGETATIDAFIAKARAQDRYNWDTRFTAEAANAWIRAGFGIGQRRLFRNVRLADPVE